MSELALELTQLPGGDQGLIIEPYPAVSVAIWYKMYSAGLGKGCNILVVVRIYWPVMVEIN
jgi:hypothetical protein